MEIRADPRLSSYVTALIAGPYQSVRSEVTSSDGRVIPLGVFARKSLMQYLDADNIFELTRQGFEFFEAQFGCPYPFEKYDQLFVPEFNSRRHGKQPAPSPSSKATSSAGRSPARRSNGAPSLSCTNWPTCGSVTW